MPLAAIKAHTRRAEPLNSGLAQLSLVEHALCPLDPRVSLRDGFQYHTGYFYGTAEDRRFSNVTVTALRGLSPNDEFFLWGLLALTLADKDAGLEFWATPYYCLRKLGVATSYRSQGGTQFQLFRESVDRLAHVIYHADAFYNPLRAEHLERTMGFLKYERPVDPKSSRQCRFVWDPLFLEFCRETAGGRLFFDLETYRELDFASRRLFLLLHKFFGGRKARTSPAYDVRHLAINVLGFAEHLPTKILKQKLSRIVERLLDEGILALPSTASTFSEVFCKRAKGSFSITFAPGAYFTRPSMPRTPSHADITDSPHYDPLHSIGFSDQEISRILRTYPHAKVQVWADVTLRAIEGARGFPGFKKDPQAFFLYHVRQAAENKLTPPEWWHAARKRDERRRYDEDRRQATIDEDRAEAYRQARHAAFEEYLKDHQDEFERLTSMFVQVHSANMYLEPARQSAVTDARRIMEGRFHFPSESDWTADGTTNPVATRVA